VADSLCLREFLQIGLDERTPDHVTISHTRRLLDEATHQEVFSWMLRQVANLALLLRKMMGAGTPRALQDVAERLFFILLRVLSTIRRDLRASTIIARLHVAPDAAPYSMCW
jgi:Transposase domain (DUF772)